MTLSSHAAFRTLEASMTLMRRAIDIVRRHDPMMLDVANAVGRPAINRAELTGRKQKSLY